MTQRNASNWLLKVDLNMLECRMPTNAGPETVLESMERDQILNATNHALLINLVHVVVLGGTVSLCSRLLPHNKLKFIIKIKLLDKKSPKRDTLTTEWDLLT